MRINAKKKTKKKAKQQPKSPPKSPPMTFIDTRPPKKVKF